MLFTPARIGKLLHTACNCSCFMCGNPRRYRTDDSDGRTVQERSHAQLSIADRLEDDYTYEELMADICTDERPCELCLRSRVRKVNDVVLR